MTRAWLGEPDVDYPVGFEHCCAECEADAEDCECEVDDLDLEIRLNTHRSRSAVDKLYKRMNLSEYSAVTGAAVNQFIETFQAPQDPYARAALRFSPFLMMSPQPKGDGVEGFIRDPRVLGAALVAGIVIIGVNRNESRKARDIKIYAPTVIRRGESATLVADVLDGRGLPIPDEEIAWTSSDTSLATIGRHNGLLTTTGPGLPIILPDPYVVVITAASGDLARRHLLTVRSSP